jgi:TM2 domain-containing membrane protein YozV
MVVLLGSTNPRVYYLVASAFFFGVGLADFGAGGQLPFLSFVTQFVSSFFAGFVGSAANDEKENAKAVSKIIVFMLYPLERVFQTSGDSTTI